MGKDSNNVLAGMMNLVETSKSYHKGNPTETLAYFKD